MEDILKNITAPDLTTVDYGKAINEQFSNIDENFKKIANHEFLKGEKGDSLKIKNIKIIENNELYNALLSAIKNEFEPETSENTESSEETLSWLDSVNGYNWDDSLGELSIPMIYSVDSITKVETYICSVGVVSFFDNRFSANSIKNASDLSVFENKIDTTCLISFDRDEKNDWMCNINKSFPRLTYKNNSFYWVINNDDTIIKATGIKGDTGNNAVLHIGKIEVESGKIQGEELYEITALFIEKDWVAIGDVEEGSIKANDPIIVYILDKDTELNSYFIGNVIEDGGSYKVKYIKGNNVTSIDFSLQSKELFRSIGKQNATEGNDPARGIFLLMNQFKRVKQDETNTVSQQDSNIDKAYAHMIYNDKQDLYILPASDYEASDPQIIESGSISDGKPTLKIGDYNTIIRSGKFTKTTSDSSSIGIEDPKLFFDSIKNISYNQPSNSEWYFNTVDVNTDGIKIYSSEIRDRSNRSSGLTVSLSNGVEIDCHTSINRGVDITGDTTISGVVGITGDITITGDATTRRVVDITTGITIKSILPDSKSQNILHLLEKKDNNPTSSVSIYGARYTKQINDIANNVSIPGLIVKGDSQGLDKNGVQDYNPAMEIYGHSTFTGSITGISSYLHITRENITKGNNPNIDIEILTISDGLINSISACNIYIKKPYNYVVIDDLSNLNDINMYSVYFSKSAYLEIGVINILVNNNILISPDNSNEPIGLKSGMYVLFLSKKTKTLITDKNTTIHRPVMESIKIYPQPEPNTTEASEITQ